MELVPIDTRELASTHSLCTYSKERLCLEAREMA